MLPNRREIYSVFSLIVFVVYSWAIYRMAWQMQGWLYYLTINQVLIVMAYIFAYALIESIIVLGIIIFFAIILPDRLLKQRFIVQGSALVAFMTVGALIFQTYPNLLSDMTLIEIVIFPLVILIALFLFLVLFSKLIERKGNISCWMLALADRLTLFPYIYIPFSLVGLMVVLIRNVI